MEIGSIYQTNNCGNVKIISINKDKATVIFLNTGTIKEFRICWINNGCIRDPYARLFCGVACTGNIKTKGKYKPYYSVWHDMIDRCYNKNNKRHAAYKNVSVCSEWLVFENFYNTCKEVDGFDENEFLNGLIVLDKYIKQRHLKNKVYSKDTCMWVSKEQNNKIQDGQQRIFYGMSPSGILYKDTNINDFARKHNLTRQRIQDALHLRKDVVCGGWRFSYEEIV